MNASIQNGTLQARVVQLDDVHALLSSPEIQELRWPRRHLPAGIQVGDTVAVQLVNPREEEEKKYDAMRRLLEELIN